MNWKAWKRGLWVACLTGLFKAAICLKIGMTGEQILYVFLVNIGIDGSLYLKIHPAEVIIDTSFIHKTPTQTTNENTILSPPPQP